MRILYVGDGTYKSRGNYYYDVGRKICNGLTRISNDNYVYFLSDRDTARSGNILRSSELGHKFCNQVFVDICANFSPDLIVFTHSYIIKTASIEKVLRMLPEVKMVNVNVDPMFSTRNIKMLREKSEYMDATFITTGGEILRKVCSPKSVVSFIPNPVDSSIESFRCHERSDQDNDVFWACRLPKGGDRELNPRLDFPLFLEESGAVKVDYRGMNGVPQVFGTSYFQAIGNARMGLNINQAGLIDDYDPSSTSEAAYLYSSDRIAHYMGNGLLVLNHKDPDRDNKLEVLFEEGREFEQFRSRAELLEKVTYYKNNDKERMEIAANGWRKCHEHFNERVVAQYIVEVAFREKLSQDYAWPTDLY